MGGPSPEITSREIEARKVLVNVFTRARLTEEEYSSLFSHFYFARNVRGSAVCEPARHARSLLESKRSGKKRGCIPGMTL